MDARASQRLVAVLGGAVGILGLLDACSPDRSAESPPAARSAQKTTLAQEGAHSAPGRPGGAPSAPVSDGSPARPSTEEAGLESRYRGRPALAVLSGQASYYGDSLAGNRTASGEVYDPRGFTAAHRTLAFGTVLRVARRDGRGHAVYVRVTDRGPFGSKRRILDLSRVAAERLEMMRAGVVEVRAEIVEYGKKRR